MTRRDFIAVAAVIRGEVDLARASGLTAAVDALHMTAEGLCVEFRAGNARFDRARFLTACGF